MKKGIIFVLTVVVVSAGSASAGIYSGGSGTETDPYRISTAADMSEIGANREDWDKHFVLTNDIDLSDYTGTQFNIIGIYRFPFTGTFDGAGHTISNFTYTTRYVDFIGLFGYVNDANALIKDLALVTPDVNAAGDSFYVGCLVGRLVYGTISDCCIEGGSVVGRDYIGGLVGCSYYGTIENCYATGSVSGDSSVGGLAGDNWGTILNCYSIASVSGNDHTGGLVGKNSGTISNCYAEGNVTGDDDTGGLVGGNWGGTILNCYAAGNVTGDNDTGGLVGSNGGTISNCYAEGSVTGADRYTGGLVGYNYDTISNCYASGDVSGEGYCVGGLVGSNSGMISNCYAAGSVSGGDCTGGLVGENREGTIMTCYATGSVDGKYMVGGLVGYNDEGTISNCYAKGRVRECGGCGCLYHGGLVGYNDEGTIWASFWDVNSSGLDISNGGEGKTTDEMQTMSTFFGWGCTTPVWTIDEGRDYPHLAWEEKPGEPIAPILSDFLDGAGTREQPYLVYTAEEFNMIGLFVYEFDKYFKVIADIDLSAYTGTEFNIIGIVGSGFSGVFDGDGHTISGFTYTTTDTDNIGLFGCVDDANAVIKNLTLVTPDVNAAGKSYCVASLVGRLESGMVADCGIEGGSVTGYRYTGGLVGKNYEGTISNCYVTGSIMGYGDVGGLVGSNSGTISNCYVTGSIMGYREVGGLVGCNTRYNKGAISNCYATGSVTGTNSTGGLVGSNRYSIISNCYATGSVTGTDWTGGLVGSNSSMISNCYAAGSVTGYNGTSGLVGYNGGTILNCYATGSVMGNYRTGGLVGSGSGMVSVSFWDIETTGQSSSAGAGEVKTTAEMKMAGTFLGWTGCGDGGGWTLDEGNDYPRLGWEGRPGQLLSVQQLSDFLSGNGTAADPYLICTAEELNLVGLFICEWDRHFVLTDDIDLSVYTGTQFNIIGTSWAYPFTGVFDGAGHTISNFTYTTTDTDYIGLFGCAGRSAVIEDLTLVNPDVSAAGHSDEVGCLVGCLRSGTITACGIEGGSVTGYRYTGGLVGHSSSGTIENGYAAVSVTGDYYTGGLVGRNYKGTISNCYAAGSVSGNGDIGGLVGWNKYGAISASFWDIETTGQSSSAGGEGKTTAEMMTMNTFTDAGWDFVTPIWTIDEGNDYPRLWYIPIADAGPNKTVYAWIDGWAEVVLDGCGSYDDDGNELTYLWSWVIDGNTYDVNGVDPVIELPVGEYVINLTVNDGIGDSEPDQVVITVIEALESRLQILPRVIVRHNRQKRILAWLLLPGSVDKEQISNEPILLYPGEIEAVRQYVIGHGRAGRKRTSVLAFFDKAELMGAVDDNGRVELEVVGSLKTGRYFHGSDTVRIKARPYRPWRSWRRR